MASIVFPHFAKEFANLLKDFSSRSASERSTEDRLRVVSLIGCSEDLAGEICDHWVFSPIEEVVSVSDKERGR